MNYWAPLNDDEEDEPEQVNIIEINNQSRTQTETNGRVGSKEEKQ
jgi:hypothetical protein